MTQDNKCDITGGYYSVIHICERCGCKYARHVGNSTLCKTCIVETEKRINKNFNYKISVVAVLFVLMFMFSISVLGASYDWVRAPSTASITNSYTNNTNITEIDNYYTANLTNMTGNCSVNYYVFGFLPNLSKVCLPFANETDVNISISAGENILLTAVYSPTTSNYTINATGRSIQTFKAVDMAIKGDQNSSRWAYMVYNSTLPADNVPIVNPYFNYSFNPFLMRESFGYWDFGYTLIGNNKRYIDLALGVPFRKIDKANRADVSVRFKMNGGSIIGANCPYRLSTPEAFMQNVTIAINRADGFNASRLLFDVNASMYNWTTLTYRNVTLDVVSATQNPDVYNWYASVVFSEKGSGQSLIALGVCVLVESISIEQYYKP